ncbi:Histone-lysine N-methyltransferase SETMAR [Orchesella cincta]|uniref:Histone-lysine N-methyltransferase SETMAR n=1 Tax=Orchesella cincta TaxID=48709 RepID=A0A1D2M1U1_ORCCI|nr:Histone-lysine N-methyltransferase SETMAR [Orchesella cincta]
MFFTQQDIRSQVQLHFLKGLSASVIESELKKDGIDPLPDRSTIIRWCQRISSSDLFLENRPNPSRPPSGTDENHVAKVDFFSWTNFEGVKDTFIIMRQRRRDSPVAAISQPPLKAPQNINLTSKVAKQKLKEVDFIELYHPNYSPNLASSGYFLFPKLKDSMRGRKYNSDEQWKKVKKHGLDVQAHHFSPGAFRLFRTGGISVLESRETT